MQESNKTLLSEIEKLTRKVQELKEDNGVLKKRSALNTDGRDIQATLQTNIGTSIANQNNLEDTHGILR